MNLYSFAVKINENFKEKFGAMVQSAKLGTTSISGNIDSLQAKLHSLQAAKRLTIDKKDLVSLNQEIALTEKNIKKLEGLGLKKSFKESFVEAIEGSTAFGFSLNLLTNPITGIVAGVAGISSALSKGIDNAAMISDRIADVRKTTNMSEQSAQSFQKSLQQIDTRTSLAGLLDIAKIGGSMGVAENELLGFTQTIDKAAVALGDEFSGGIEEVAKNLGVLKDLFADTKGLKYDEAMSRIGSSINHLGSISKGTGGNISDFAKRMGTLGSLAPKLTDTLALGATMESLGINSEIAGSGLSKIISQAGAELPAFAKWLGISESKMKNMLNTDPTQVLLSFANSLKGLKNDQVIAVMDKLKIGTDEAKKSIMTLAGNTEMFSKLQAESAKAYTENTSLSDEFAIKNNTLAAKIDKAKNSLFNMSLALGGLVAPVVEKVSSLVAGLIGDGNTLISVLKGMAIGAGIGGAAYLAYSLVVNGVSNTLKLATLAQYALNLAMSMNPVGLLIGALALLGAGVAYAYNKFEGFRGLIWGVWEAMQAIIEKAKLFGKTVVAMLSGNWEQVMSLAKQNNAISITGAFEQGKQKGIADFQTENGTGKETKTLEDVGKVLAQDGKTYTKNENSEGGIASLLDKNSKITPDMSFLNKDTNKKSNKSGLGAGISEIKSDVGVAKNITINVEALIKEVNFNKTEMKQSVNETLNMLKQGLLAVVNDANTH